MDERVTHGTVASAPAGHGAGNGRGNVDPHGAGSLVKDRAWLIFLIAGTVGSIAVMCRREASSGTTPP